MGPCQECSAMATALARSLFAAQKPEDDAAYDGAIERARRGAKKRHRAHLREQAEVEKVASLLAGSSGLVEVGRKMPRKMEEIARFELLLSQSWSLRHENPAEMVQLAILAVQHSKTLSTHRHGPERVFDLQGRAHAELGNAYRLR